MLILTTRFSLKWFTYPCSLHIEEISREEAKNIVSVADEFGNFKSKVVSIDEVWALRTQLDFPVVRSEKPAEKLSDTDHLMIAMYQGMDIKASIRPYKDMDFKFYLVSAVKEVDHG